MNCQISHYIYMDYPLLWRLAFREAYPPTDEEIDARLRAHRQKALDWYIKALKGVLSDLDCLGEHDLAQACIDALDTWEEDQGK